MASVRNAVNVPRRAYSAVSIVSRGRRCAAAAELEDQRFLSTEAPQLPLQDCNRLNECRCRYKHWDDRRQEDRRSPYQGGVAAGLSSNRRDGGDRRD